MGRLLAFALALAWATTLSFWPAQADDGDHYISVTGQGIVPAAPDMAEVVAGVATRAPTARAALDQNSAVMTRVAEALHLAGIEDRDIRTTRISVAPMLSRGDRDKDSKQTGFRAVDYVTLRVRDLSQLGSFLDSVAAAGATEIQGVQFGLVDPEKLIEQARRMAMADARRRADQLAQAAEISINWVERIEENVTEGPRPMPMAITAESSAARPAPVSPGEQEIRVVVTVRYGID